MRAMGPSSEPPSGNGFPERRSEERLISCIPVSLEVPDNTDLALIRDISRSGAFLLTRTSFEIGEPLSLRLHLVESSDGVPVKGRVVRVEPHDSLPNDLWHYEIGVQFEEPLDEYAEQIRALSERQAQLGLFQRVSKRSDSGPPS
jgi:Tfp pilus assembly protein PilZ